MKWFGPPWGSIESQGLKRIPVPVGEKCFHCECSIGEQDRGLVLPYSSAEGTKDTYWHLVCLKKTILG